MTLLPSDETPEKITDTTGICSSDCFGACELHRCKFVSLEAEIAVNFLRNAKPDILNSVNASAPQYRKLMDEIIEYVVQSHDVHADTLPEDRDLFEQVLSAKNQMLLLFVFIWIIGVALVIFFTSDSRSPYHGPMPT